MFLFFTFLSLSVFVAFLHLLLSKKGLSALRVVEIFLLYQLVFNIGFLGFLAFFGLTFMQEHVAKHNNWPQGPFQQEMGNVNLAFGVLGILSIWFRGLFWAATCIGASIWLFADGLNHLFDMLFRKNYSEGNTGVLLYSDLLIPVALMTLLFFYYKLQKKKAPSS